MLGRIEVRGRSMEPTLLHGARAWTESFTYRWRPPRVGDLVVVDHPHRALRLVKRVRAGPGDKVGDRRLGPDEYFVAGDNAAASTGSERFGPVPRRLIRARVLVRARRRT